MRKRARNEAMGADERITVAIDLAAEMLDVSESSFRQLVNADEIPFVQIGSERRYPRALIEQWAVENAQFLSGIRYLEQRDQDVATVAKNIAKRTRSDKRRQG